MYTLSELQDFIHTLSYLKDGPVAHTSSPRLYTSTCRSTHPGVSSEVELAFWESMRPGINWYGMVSLWCCGIWRLEYWSLMCGRSRIFNVKLTVEVCPEPTSSELLALCEENVHLCIKWLILCSDLNRRLHKNTVIVYTIILLFSIWTWDELLALIIPGVYPDQVAITPLMYEIVP